MSALRRIFVLAGGAEWEGPLLNRLDTLSDVLVVRRCIDVADLLAASKTDHAEYVLIDPAVPGLDLDVVERLSNEGLTLWAVGSEGAHLGIQNSVHTDEVLLIGERLSDPSFDIYDPDKNRTDNEPEIHNNHRGRVTAVWGPTGAPGRSTIALALAASGARKGESTLLIDADTWGASVAQMLAILDDVSGIMAACRDINLGRNRRIEEHVLQVLPGLDVLTGIPRPDLWHHIKPTALARVVEQARETHQHIVLDCSFDLESGEPAVPARGELTRRLLEESDLTLLVAKPDPISIARMLRASEDCKELASEVAVVINGMRPSTPWTETQIADMVFQIADQRPIAFLPFDAHTCDRALLRGEAVTEASADSQLSLELRRLSSMIRSTMEPLASEML